MQITGYVFSRKSNQEFAIIRAGPLNNNLDKKVYTYFKYLVSKKTKQGGNYETMVRSET